MEWLAYTDPPEMLEFLERRASLRKLQLFAVACCRRAWHLSSDPRHRNAVEATELYSNGLINKEEFEQSYHPMRILWGNLPPASERGPFDRMTSATCHLAGRGNEKYAAMFAAWGLADLAGEADSRLWHSAQRAEETTQCDLIRDIFGSPFRPFEFGSNWLAGDGRAAATLARAIDEGGRFENLPALADTLERAGCDDPAIVTHCRGTSIHV